MKKKNMLSIWHQLSPEYRKDITQVALRHDKIGHSALMLMSISKFAKTFCKECSCKDCTLIRRIVELGKQK